MAYHLLPKPEQEARDLRIVKLAGLGVRHSDIGRAVGLSTETIGTLLRRRRNEGKESSQVGARGSRRFEWPDSVDCVSG